MPIQAPWTDIILKLEKKVFILSILFSFVKWDYEKWEKQHFLAEKENKNQKLIWLNLPPFFAGSNLHQERPECNTDCWLML